MPSRDDARDLASELISGGVNYLPLLEQGCSAGTSSRSWWQNKVAELVPDDV